jgi:23S rRNA (adenine-N6)-dimethyltransferase
VSGQRARRARPARAPSQHFLRTSALAAELVADAGIGADDLVLWNAWYRFSLLRRLPASAFDPPPTVDAGVLAVERRAVPLVDERAWRDYRRFVAGGFRRGLSASASHRVLRCLRFAGAAPRELDAHQWAQLFRAARRA